MKRPLFVSVFIIGLTACHSSKEMTDANGKKTKSKVQVTTSSTAKPDAMMRGDSMKMDH